MPKNDNLLCALTSFWSVSCNAFHFKFGMMSPTLLVMVILFGLKPYNHVLDTNKPDQEYRGINVSYYWSSVAYEQWVTCYKSTGLVKE